MHTFRKWRHGRRAPFPLVALPLDVTFIVLCAAHLVRELAPKDERQTSVPDE